MLTFYKAIDSFYTICGRIFVKVFICRIACQDPTSGRNQGLPDKIMVDLEGSQAAVHHPFLQGEYELVRGGLDLVLGEGNLNYNNSLEISPVWQKSDKKLNKKFYIFQQNGGK